MARVVGIDPGTVSFDLFGWEEGEVFLDASIPSRQVAEDPEGILALLEEGGPLDYIAGPSGYGLPLVSVREVGEREMFLMTLVEAEERKEIPVLAGMERMINLSRERELPLFFTTAVIHMTTVPPWRKVNRIDMGTTDKLNCAILAIYDQARQYNIPYGETSFVLAEVGGAYTTVVAVQGGQVVDGIGGSVGAPGFRSPGALDGELAYLLGQVTKGTLFKGGALDVAGDAELTPAEFAARLQGGDGRVREAWEMLVEGVAKFVAAELTLVPGAREIILSGRQCREPLLLQDLEERLRLLAPVRRVTSLAAEAKEAAQGAALLAAGLVGGETAPLVENLRIREAAGTVLDYICPWGKELKGRFGI